MWRGISGQAAGNEAEWFRRLAPEAQELADQAQRVIDIRHAHSELYTYEVFVMRTR